MPDKSTFSNKFLYTETEIYTVLNCYTKIFTVLSKKSLTTSEIFANI